MKKLLTLSLAALLLMSPIVPAMANDNEIEMETKVEIEMEKEYIPLSSAYGEDSPEIGLFLDLVNSPSINQPGGRFQSNDIFLNQGLSTRANVWFHNQGSATVTITLARHTLFGTSRTTLMTLGAGDADYVTPTLTRNTRYTIEVTNTNGSNIVGGLRVRQL